MARQLLALQDSRLIFAVADVGAGTRSLRIERLRREGESKDVDSLALKERVPKGCRKAVQVSIHRKKDVKS